MDRCCYKHVTWNRLPGMKRCLELLAVSILQFSAHGTYAFSYLHASRYPKWENVSVIFVSVSLSKGHTVAKCEHEVFLLFISYKFVKGFLAIAFLLLETYMMCVNVFYIHVTGNEISVGSDKK